MSWLRFLRPRGLFVKQVASFFLAFIAVWLIVGTIDVGLSNARFQRDAGGLLERADFAALAAPAGRVDPADPVACRHLADTVLWGLVDQGVREVSDFVDLVAYFKDGRLNVRVLDGGRVACATAPAPVALLRRALDAELR
ncbi:hypothetical protein, partial [Lysobacter enzymogenes]|uniref:hypothetical protein n=1 Tax=Lysobacter enzymogenes TaxID=69 RepID=UPI0019D011A1